MSHFCPAPKTKSSLLFRRQHLQTENTFPRRRRTAIGKIPHQCGGHSCGRTLVEEPFIVRAPQRLLLRPRVWLERDSSRLPLTHLRSAMLNPALPGAGEGI